MPPGIGAIATGMSLASPHKRSGLAIPGVNGVTEPVFEDLHVIDMLTRQRPCFDDALHRFGHVEPGASIGRREQQDAVLGTPLHDAVAFMPSQIIPDEQHPHWREKAVQLLGCRIDIPILPAPPLGYHRRRRRALLQDGGEFPFEPGMQDGIGAALCRFRAYLSRRWTQQREQFERPTANVLMGQACRLALELPGGTRLWDRLIRAPFILAPQLQPEAFCELIGMLDHRLFLLAQRVEARVHLAILAAVQRLANLTPATASLPAVAHFV